MATDVGQQQSSGTGIIEIPAWPHEQGDAFELPFDIMPRVVLTGSWERTGGNTFAFTAYGWIMDPTGAAPVLLAKQVGTQTITGNCNTLKVESTVELLTPAREAPEWAPSPFNKVTVPAMIGYRISVERE